MEQHTADVLAVIHRLGLAPTHLAGLSMGGFVASPRGPDLLRSLTLLNTSAAHSPAKIPRLLALAAVARAAGVSMPVVLAGPQAEMYGETFRRDPTRAALRATWRQRWNSSRSARSAALRSR